MKLKNLFLSACLLAAVAVSAQEVASPWKFSGLVGLNASATGLVNWAAGGNNNVSGIAFGKLNLNYAENDLAWDTQLDLEYGLTWVDQKFDQLQKSSDRIKFDTKFGYQFANKVFVAANASFQSQFALGRAYDGTAAADPIISKFLAPSYTEISVGIDYKPADIFSLYVSPIAGKITTAYTGDNLEAKNPGLREGLQEAFGTYYFDKVTNDKVYRNYTAELGLSLKGTLNYTYKDLKIMSTLGLFTPYKWDKVMMYAYDNGTDIVNYTEAGLEKEGIATTDANAFKLGYRDNNRRFGNFDVNWDVAISYQFLKCLNVTLSTSLKYINGVKIADKEGLNPTERVQFMGVLGLGVGYSF